MIFRIATKGEGVKGENSLSAHIAVSATPHRHSNFIACAQEIIHGLGSRIHEDCRALAIRERVARALIDHQRARRQRGGDGVCVVGEVLGVVDEGAESVVAPPGGALLRVL